MAKAEDTTQLEKNVDMLTEAMLELRRMFNAMKAENDDMRRELSILKADAQVASQEVMLPREIREGVSPGQIYTSAVQAFIIGYISSNPSLLIKQGRENQYGMVAADRAVEFGDLMVKAFHGRFGIPPADEPKKK